MGLEKVFERSVIAGECHTYNVYLPKHFEVKDLDEVARFVSRTRSADLITINSEAIPEATLMPCIWERSRNTRSEYGALVMHMARTNQQWKSIGKNKRALAIVHGPEAYVSPSNYEAKATDHRVVPTWNYQSVHFTGTVEVSEDLGTLREIVTNLTEFHETPRATPWLVSEANPTYFEAQLKGIVAVILHVEKVEAKYKLSQNRSDTDREKVISDLENSSIPSEREIASEMINTLQRER